MCSICKLLQGKLYGNPNHEASEFSQAMLERTGRQSLFRGPNASPKIIVGGPKNVTEFILDRRKSQKLQNRGPEKTFSGRAKSSPKMEILRLRPEDRVIARDVASQFMSNFACIRH